MRGHNPDTRCRNSNPLSKHVVPNNNQTSKHFRKVGFELFVDALAMVRDGSNK
jgi:hypothetical protein